MKRRVFSVLFAVLFTFILCSCSNKNLANVADTSSKNLPELKIGFSFYEPYFYLDESGDYKGIDVEIASEACKRLGYHPVFVESSMDKMDSLLDSGKIDCMWGRFYMNDRQADYNWAGPYLKSPITLCTRANSKINTLNDLTHMTVATFVNSYTERYFLGKADEDAPDIQALYTYNSLDEAFAAFNKGYVDAIAAHKNGLEAYTVSNPDAYHYLASPLYISPLGVAFSKSSDPSTAQAFTKAFHEMYEDGFIPATAKTYGLNSDYLVEGYTNE